MEFRKALNLTIEAFDLKAAELSRLSGVGENQISNYRKGKKDLYSENLQAVINSLPPEAKQHFYGLILTKPLLCA